MSHLSLSNDVKWGAIGKEVYERTYSRTKPDGTKETWEDTVNRVVDGNLAFVDTKYHELGERDALYKLIYSMKALPAGRHLWCTGVKDRSYINNCYGAGFPNGTYGLVDHFSFVFEMLLKGGGVGSNYSNRYIEKYEPIANKVNLRITCSPEHSDYSQIKEYLVGNERDLHAYDIQDSREGWCDALWELMTAFWSGKNSISFDISSLRSASEPLKTFGGRSAGPSPLVILLTNITKFLNSKVGKKLTSLDLMTLDHEISKAVISGGIRRSARMSIKHWADPDIQDFIDCKRSPENHWSTNISIEIDKDFFDKLKNIDKRANKMLKDISERIYESGEPGLFNRELAAKGEHESVFCTNPCLSYDTQIITSTGLVSIGKWAEDNIVRQVWDGSKWVKAKAFYSGKKPVVRLTLSNGMTLKMTGDHKIGLLEGGYVKAEDSQSCNLDPMLPETFKEGHRITITVLSVDDCGMEDVYDFSMEETHWASVSGFRIANCGEVNFSGDESEGSFDVCCLAHVNLASFDIANAEYENSPELLEAFRLMTRFLIRATFADPGNERVRGWIDKNRRIGVGFFGFHHWLTKQDVKFSESHKNESIRLKLKSMYNVCKNEAIRYAIQLKISTPIKITAVAPTGSISNLPGVSSACQPIFARYYKRLINYSSDDPNLIPIIDKGYQIEDSVYSRNTKVVTFWCEDSIIAECERLGLDTTIIEEQDEISIEDHLSVQAMIQEEFADNAVSYTVNFDPKHVLPQDIENALRNYLPRLKGTTMMPICNSGRPQMPIQKISKEEFDAVREKGLGKVGDIEKECTSGCPIK